MAASTRAVRPSDLFAAGAAAASGAVPVRGSARLSRSEEAQRQFTISSCAAEFERIFRLEDKLMWDGMLSERILLKLNVRKNKARKQMFAIQGGIALVEEVDRHRLDDKLAKLAHEKMMMPSIRNEDHVGLFHPVEQAELAALFGVLALKGVHYERKYLDTAVLSGRCGATMQHTNALMLRIMRQVYGYDASMSEEEVAERREQVVGLVGGATTEDVYDFMRHTIFFLIVGWSAGVLDRSNLPETLRLDADRIARLASLFRMQFVVVTLVKYLIRVRYIRQKKSSSVFFLVDAIATAAIADKLGFDDIDKLASVAYNVLQEHCLNFTEADRQELRAGIAGAMHSNSDERVCSLEILQDVLYSAIDYHNEFTTTKKTVDTFGEFAIPIEARSIAPMLHEQGVEIEKLLQLHLDVHGPRYEAMMPGVAIQVLYEYP